MIPQPLPFDGYRRIFLSARHCCATLPDFSHKVDCSVHDARTYDYILNDWHGVGG